MKLLAHRLVFPLFLASLGLIHCSAPTTTAAISLLSLQVPIHFLHSTSCLLHYNLASRDLFYIKHYTCHMSSCIHLFMNQYRRKGGWREEKGKEANSFRLSSLRDQCNYIFFSPVNVLPPQVTSCQIYVLLKKRTLNTG